MRPDGVMQCGNPFVEELMKTDEKGGHDNGWMSETHLKCIHDAIENVKTVIEKTNGEYTVVVTADHDGHAHEWEDKSLIK